MKTRTILAGFLGVLTLAWIWDALWMHTLVGAMPWVLRQHGLYLTGLYAISLMSLIMILATRPAWIESLVGGMDKVYLLHKHAGILAIVFSAMHWLIKLSNGPLKTWIGTADRPAKEAVISLLLPARGIAKDLGEWSVYLLLGMLILTLWKSFPYKSWRLVHKIMPLIYLVLAFHAIALLPMTYWLGPSGALQAVLLSSGTFAAIAALTNRIGVKRQHNGHIESIRNLDDVVEVRCHMDASWPGHKAGQFAFVSFDKAEGAHPFTIASADQGDARTVTFQIKGLGDYTNTLAHHLAAGQAVQVEGPYGRFLYGNHRKDARQIWVAGGIGITPFLAWLEDMRLNPSNATPAQLHYCVRNAKKDPFVARLRTLCNEIPSVTLQLHDASRQERLNALTVEKSLGASADDPIDIWFCGPTGLARNLRTGFRNFGKRDVQIRKEAFEMR